MTRRVQLGPLARFVTAAFVGCGVPAGRARGAAQALCYADAAGIDSHGVGNLERLYVTGLLSGAIDPRARPRTVRAAGAVALLDGAHGLGPAIACEATGTAVELARRNGAGVVSVRGGGHFGPAGHYAATAARAGCIAIVMSNCGGQRIVPAPGGGEPVLGTNPIAIAVPTGEQPPFVLDMSTTVVSAGRVRRAAAARTPLPAGVLVGADGRGETRAGAYDGGGARLLWLGGHADTGAYKGFGLGLAVDLLSGLLSGAGCGPLADLGEPARDVGHLVVALDVSFFHDRDAAAFAARCDALLAALLAAGGAGASYPGTPESAERRRRERDGILAGPALQAMFDRVAQRCGITTEGLYER
jgi:LDH2 family malate/lactate/ureidoglycolate dehydrogenase